MVDNPHLNKISRRTALALPLGLAASSGTIFSNGFAKADEPVRGGTMVMIVQPEPSTLAHYAVTAGNIPPIATQIYEGLVTYDWDQNPQPNLATSWETAPDGKSITFKLREGVVFHNGKPFTSADVQFSFMEILKKYHPFAPLLLAELTGVDTPDEKTAVLLLANPAPYLMKALAGRDLPRGREIGLRILIPVVGHKTFINLRGDGRDVAGGHGIMGERRGLGLHDHHHRATSHRLIGLG